jgi:hypothetical protein
MASNLYRVGIGMMGGRTGTYGRYSIGPRVNGLAPQFNKSANVEEQQMRRFGRKKESGYTGAGYWYSNYPNMIGAMGSGAVTNEIPNPTKKMSKSKNTATAADTMGIGGTTFNGASGVS